MSWMTDSERAFVEAVSTMAWSNPFLATRIDAEAQALGEDFVGELSVWTADYGPRDERPNVTLLRARTSALLADLRARLEPEARRANRPTTRDLELYEDLAFYVLYAHFEGELFEVMEGQARVGPVWRRFAAEVEQWLRPPSFALPSTLDPAHLFACFFQIRRAFHHIFWGIHGRSQPAAELRAAVWQSVFTHDLRRYYVGLHAALPQIPTLITGPTGSGKELVALAIGASGYRAFDPEQGFAGAGQSFVAAHLAAVSANLVEAELFGHAKGAFTGADQARAGLFESAVVGGVVFLDEIGELTADLQVKLLRVLQTRTCRRVGTMEDRPFVGRIVCATNRDLAAEVEAGRFREDLYYRICADRVRTPSLEARVAADPLELEAMVHFLAQRLAQGPAARSVAAEAVAWIEAELGGHHWPGNVRELEQCVRSVALRGAYLPERQGETGFEAELRRGSLDAEGVLRGYARRIHAETGSYSAAARRLGLDRRTVKRYVESD